MRAKGGLNVRRKNGFFSPSSKSCWFHPSFVTLLVMLQAAEAERLKKLPMPKEDMHSADQERRERTSPPPEDVVDVTLNPRRQEGGDGGPSTPPKPVAGGEAEAGRPIVRYNPFGADGKPLEEPEGAGSAKKLLSPAKEDAKDAASAAHGGAPQVSWTAPMYLFDSALIAAYAPQRQTPEKPLDRYDASRVLDANPPKSGEALFIFHAVATPTKHRPFNRSSIGVPDCLREEAAARSQASATLCAPASPLYGAGRRGRRKLRRRLVTGCGGRAPWAHAGGDDEAGQQRRGLGGGGSRCHGRGGIR